MDILGTVEVMDMDEIWLARDSKAGGPRKGGKLARSETITVRLDPKLRYLAELAARRQRRTISSFVEWAVQESLKSVMISEGGFNVAPITVHDAANALWDVVESDRFVRLAYQYPDTLSHTEQVLWKLIRECGYLWRGSYTGPRNEWTWSVRDGNLVMDRFRDCWEVLKEVARGEKDRSALPQWTRFKAVAEPEVEPPDPEDDLDNAPSEDEEL